MRVICTGGGFDVDGEMIGGEDFVFSAIGETINIMTLGGLALAVGILVDDATVEVENINRNREAEPEKDMDEVVLESAVQIAAPAFVATLSICIVFAPTFLLSGVARYLFVPLAEAVVFAMLASYFLSRTIVPTMAKYLLRGERKRGEIPPSAIRWRGFRSALRGQLLFGGGEVDGLDSRGPLFGEGRKVPAPRPFRWRLRYRSSSSVPVCCQDERAPHNNSIRAQ